MQIHELTKVINEVSIADTIKSAGTAIKKGAQAVGQRVAQSDVVQQNIKPLAQTIQQGQVASPTAYAANKQAATQAQAAKYAQKLQAQGYGTAATATAQPGATVQTGQTSAPAVNTNRLQAGPVATGQAGAVMTTPDFNAAIRQLQLTPTHITSLKDGFAKNPAFAVAFLKATGLKK